jgi:transcriptional regulator with XRE-family HTH domain
MNDKHLLLPRAIRQAREQRGWTQTMLAERLGISQAAVSFWERGIETPSVENQVQLVTVLPEIFEEMSQQVTSILSRLYRLERVVHGGQCRCSGCDCPT